MGPTSTHVSARASGDPSSSQSVTQVAAASRSVAAAAEKRQRKLLVALKNPAGSFQQNPSTSASKCERKEFWKFAACGASLINNQKGTDSLKNGTSQVGSKGWDWSLGSIQDP